MIYSKLLFIALLGLIVALAIAYLSAVLASPPSNQKKQPPMRVGMANPAAVYCIKLGGWLETRNSPAGQSAYCHLPSGEVIEEWELFRRDHKR